MMTPGRRAGRTWLKSYTTSLPNLAMWLESRHNRVLCTRDGASVTQKVVQVAVRRGAQTSERQAGRSHPAAHVLFAPGNARRAGKSDSGARRTSGPADHAALHVPEPGRDRRGHQRPIFIEGKWWRRREPNLTRVFGNPVFCELPRKRETQDPLKTLEKWPRPPNFPQLSRSAAAGSD